MTENNQQTMRNKCPKCDGEFEQWDEMPGLRKCPFCGLHKGMYDPDKNRTLLKNMAKLTKNLAKRVRSNTERIEKLEKARVAETSENDPRN